MDAEEPNPPQSPPSPRRRAAALAFAGILLLLLLDLAAETFLAGSPVRWVPVFGVVGYVATATVLRRRLSAFGAAWSALFVLLGVLATTSWMTGGTTTGVVVTRQPTASVLAAVAALGVVLGGVSLGRLKALPLPAKGVVVLLALYSLWSFAWGIILRTPYPELLHGGSRWQQLPFWLQGAFVGAVIIVPAGLLAQLLAWHDRSDGRTPRSKLRRFAAMALIASITIPGLRGPTAVGVNAGTSNAQSSVPLQYPVSVQGSVLPPVGASLDDETTSRQLDRIRTIANRLVESIDRADVDPAARAATLGPNPESVFAFVRDTIAFEPYPGVLRGPEGALISRRANALDRSLLLAELLIRSGHKARIAQGALSDGAVEKLWNRSLDAERGLAAVSRDTVAASMASEAGAKWTAAVDTTLARGARVQEWINQRATRDAGAIRRAMGETEGWFRDAGFNQLRSQLRRHFWVQVWRGSTWLDLDSSFRDATPGQCVAENASAHFDVTAVPRDLVQTVRFAVTAEYESGGTRSGRVVLDSTFPATTFVTRQARLSNAPLDINAPEQLAQARRFVPILVVGDQRRVGTEFALDETRTGPAGGPDLSGGLFGESPQPSELVGLWVEVTLSSPGSAPTVERRYLVDRVGLTQRESKSSRRSGRLVPDPQLPYQVMRSFDILVLPAPYPEFLPAWLWGRWMQDNDAVARIALDVRFGRTGARELARAAGRAPRFNPVLAELGLAASEKMVGLANGSRLALTRPMIVFHRRLVRAVGNDLTMEEGLDIVVPGVLPLSASSKERAARGLDYGAWLTNLELAYASEIAAGGAVDNASANLEMAESPLTLVREISDSDSRWGSSDTKAAVRSDLRRGFLVVGAVGQPTGKTPASWWRVDPDSGVVLGLSETGEGHAVARRIPAYHTLPNDVGGRHPTSEAPLGAVIGLAAGDAGQPGAEKAVLEADTQLKWGVAVQVLSTGECFVKVVKIHMIDKGDGDAKKWDMTGAMQGTAVCAVGFAAGFVGVMGFSKLFTVLGLAISWEGDILGVV